MKLFKKSNSEADAVGVLRVQVVEMQPLRIMIKGMTDANASDSYDPSVLATAAVDPYLMSLSGGKYFEWDRQQECGIDCAGGVDSLLVIAAAMSVSPNNKLTLLDTW